MKLPKAEQNLEDWQTATSRLIGAAEGRDFMMHARIGMLRALNRYVERVFNPDQSFVPLMEPHIDSRRWAVLLQFLNTRADACAGCENTLGIRRRFLRSVFCFLLPANLPRAKLTGSSYPVSGGPNDFHSRRTCS
jgi:hypothetical protein